MSRTERAVLLFLLAMSGGAADGWSFLGFGDVFVANMTGNTALLGISVFSPHISLVHSAAGGRYGVAKPAIALAAYALGVAIASYVTGKRIPRAHNLIWARSVTWLLTFEALCTIAVECAWYAYRGGAHVPVGALIAAMAVCMGLQSGAVLQLHIPGIVTTYITGTWTVMVRGVTRLATGERLEPHRSKAEFEERLEMQAVTLGLYLLSAVTTGWLFEEAPRFVGLFPVVCLVTVSVWAMLRGGAEPVSD